MTPYRFERLNPLRFPLVARFYKTHYPSGAPRKDEVIWTAEGEKGLCGAVRFRQFDTDRFQLLTGMLIAPELRRQKLGVALLEAVQEQIDLVPCYCLAFRHLVPLYQQAGFNVIDVQALPASLKGRYISYCNSGKDLVPMMFASREQC